MVKTFCDRCGEEIPNFFESFDIYEPAHDYYATLCSKCSYQLIEWIGKGTYQRLNREKPRTGEKE